MRPLNLRSILRKSALALAVAGVLGGIAAAPASAEEWYRHGGYGHYDHDDGWRAREWRAHESREHRYHRGYGYYAPGYYYAPPVVTFGFNFR